MSSFLKSFVTPLRGRHLAIGLGVVLCLGGVRSLAGCQKDDGNQPDAGPVDAAPSAASQGKALVAMYGCAGCHEPTGKQGGVLSGQMNPVSGSNAYGPNLTPDSDTGIGDWSDDEITRAVRTGIDDEGAELCMTMPRFSTLSDSDMKSIIAYLRSLPATHSEIPDSECPPIKPVPDDGGTTDGP